MRTSGYIRSADAAGTDLVPGFVNVLGNVLGEATVIR